MITVIQSLDKTTLYLKSNYYYSERLKRLPCSSWNHELKVWTIPVEYINYLEQEFQGELFYKTPKWVILNQPMPDLSSLYTIDENIKAPELKAPYKLYDYQRFGARFAIDRINKYGFALIADSVGSGKTLNAISVLLHQINNSYHKIAIICKKSIKYQWKEEIEKFTDIPNSFNIYITGDTKTKRDKVYKEFDSNTNSILITNYQTFLNDESQLSNLNFDFIIIDEAHVVSSYGTKTNSAMTRVLSNIPCLFLTGTPIQSRPEQVYGIINICNPNYFGRWSNFKKEYIVETFTGNYTQTVGAKNLDKLRQKIQDIMIRRTEYEISVQLPKTIEQNIEVELDKVQISLIEAINNLREKNLTEFEQHQQNYQKIRSQKEYELTQKYDAQKEYELMKKCDAQIKGLIAASQATADDPSLFRQTKSPYLKQNFLGLIPQSYSMSSKMETVIDIVDNIISGGDKVIIFTKFVTSALLISDWLIKKLKINTLFYTGRESDDIRKQNVKLFKEDDTYPVLIGTEAAAEGLNLQCAKYIINFNLPDTAAIYTQRIGRVRRVGSNYNQIIVYNMITKGSKDESRWENILNNKNLEDGFVNIDEAQRVALLKAMEQN